MLDLIRDAQRCHESEIKMQRWLLEKETYGLDKLGFLDEAEALTNRFFEEYFEDAPDEMRAGGYASRFKYQVLRGKLLAAVGTYRAGEPYYASLPTKIQWQIRLDAALLYRKMLDYQQARSIIYEVRTQADSVSIAMARTYHLEASILLRSQASLQSPNPDSIEVALTLLEKADSIYRHKDFRRLVVTGSERGWALTLLGKHDEALIFLNQNLDLAEQHHHRREIIYTHYRRGQLYFHIGDFGRADLDLSRAVNAINEYNFHEYETEVLLTWGRVQEARNEREKALAYYNDAKRKAELSQNQETIRAANQAELRVAELEMIAQKSPAGWLGLGVLILIVIIQGYVIIRTIRERQDKKAPPPEVRTVVEKEIEYVPLYPQLVEPEPTSDREDDKFDLRRKCVFKVIQQPEEVAKLTNDEDLKGLALDPQRLHFNTVIFKLAHVYECQSYGGDPMADPTTLYRTTLSKPTGTAKQSKYFRRTGLEMPVGYWAWHNHFSVMPNPEDASKFPTLA